MIYKILGKQHKTGTYHDKPYDNTMLFCSATGVPNVEGEMTAVIKVKTEILPDTVKIGDLVDVYYNAYGAVENVFPVNVPDVSPGEKGGK